MTEATNLKRDVILNPQRIGLVEAQRRDWVANAEQGTTIQDVLNPGYWAHKAAEFSPYDHIEVREETGLWVIELLVLEVARTWAKVFVLHKHDLTGAAESTPPPVLHKVEWKGPQHKHSVIRLSDGAMVKDGFAKAVEAHAWLQSHEAVVSA